MWNVKPRIGLVITYAPLEVGWELAESLICKAEKTLAPLPLETIAFPKPVFDLSTSLEAADTLAKAEVDCVVWMAATWAFDSMALEFLRRCPVPLLAWGRPGMEIGSLCGSQQLIEVLTELDRPCGFVHGEIDDPNAHANLLAFGRASAAFQRLRQARFGMLGHRTVGMTEVTFHEYDLFEQFGTAVYYRGADRLLDDMQKADPSKASTLWTSLKQRCGQCSVADECGQTAMRCYLALKDWISKDQLHGVAVGCYPDLMGIVCLACGLLAEEGIVTSCEGDMNSLVLTAVMQLMSTRPIHNTDLLFADRDENACTMSHCGNSAISLAAAGRDVALEHVRLMDQGVVSLYTAAPGRVTIANLCGRKGTYRLTCCTGEAVPTGMVFPGIPVKVKLDAPMDAFLHETAAFGTGHHWIVAYGDLGDALRIFARFADLKPLFLEP